MTSSRTAYQRLPTGVDGLDLLLDGGLRYPSNGSIFVVILGGPGSGKTHLALELAVRTLARIDGRGGCHVYYSLDQSPADLHAKLREDFDLYGMSGDWRRIVGSLETDEQTAQIHEFKPGTADERYLVLASLREPPRELMTKSSTLFERLDRDVAEIARLTGPVGTPLSPRLVAIDNVSIAAFDDGSGARAALHSIRQHLAERRLHGIFVFETPGGSGDHAAFTAAEYAADVIVQLGYHQVADQFKERSIEIAKARHQFYFRGTHHFSIAGRNEGGELRGGRGQRPPGIHVYPSVPTILSHLGYRGAAPATSGPVRFGVADLTIPAGSTTGLVGPPRRATTAHRILLDFLLAEQDLGLLISFRESERELRESARRWIEPERAQRLHVLSFAPEYLSAGKFLKDVYDELAELRRAGKTVRRAALWGLGHLKIAFPLLNESRMLLPWLSVFFKQQGISSLFVEAANGVHSDGTVVGESAVPSSVDHLLFLVDRSDGGAELQLVRSLSARSEKHGRTIPVPDEVGS
jgi:KaiC/GvpD/RAD55 family RecA-like ATPase